jgi:hypothetical protein
MMGRRHIVSVAAGFALAAALTGCTSSPLPDVTTINTPTPNNTEQQAASASASVAASALLQTERQTCAAIGGMFVNYGTIISETYMACHSTQSGDATNGKPCSAAYVGLQPSGLLNNGELGIADINYPGCFTR